LHSDKNPYFSLSHQIQQGKLYVSVTECSLSKELLLSLERLEKREEVEKVLARELRISPQQLIIDIPEPISFETDLYVVDEHKLFSDCSTAFTRETVHTFESSVRVTRVFIAPDVQTDVQALITGSQKAVDLLHNPAEWVHLV
jgi:hypothetical protein